MRFDGSGIPYRASPRDARAQFALLRRLMPILPALDSVGQSLSRRGTTDPAAAFAAIAPLAAASEDDMAFVVDAALASCEREIGGEWHPALDGADDLDLDATLQIVAHVVTLNFGAFFQVPRPDFWETPLDGPSYQPVTMPNGTDWLYRPALRSLCTYTDLCDGTLHIADVAEMNNLLDVADENQRRAHQAAEKARP